MGVIEYDLGNLGEAIAASFLSIVFDGETQKETLRGEGKGALDLQLKYPKPFGSKTTFQVGVQVKTGKSFVRWNKTNAHWTLQNIEANHIKKWQANNQPVIIVWVNPLNYHESYWKLVGAKTSSEVLHLSKKHIIRPEALFEIHRLISILYKKVGGIARITLKNFDSVSSARKWSKKEFAKIKGVYSNEYGDFEISNYVFRHVTRASRNKSHIKESLQLLPYTKTFLDKIPHQIQTIAPATDDYESEKDAFTIIKRKVVYVFRNVRFNDIPSAVVYLRFKETIIYPTNWISAFCQGKQTRHSLILESIYRKTE